MKRILIGLAAMAAATAAHAADRYDRKIEQAAMQIVAGKIGNIRGGFSYRDQLQAIVEPSDQSTSPDRTTTGSIGPQASAAIAPDAFYGPMLPPAPHKVSRIILF